MSNEYSLGSKRTTRFAYDKTDFKAATLTGYNTFHATGGIACVTPPVSNTDVLKKIKKTLEGSHMIVKFGYIPINFLRDVGYPPTFYGDEFKYIEVLLPNQYLCRK